MKQAQVFSSHIKFCEQTSPVVTKEGKLHLQLRRQLDNFRKADPPPKSQLALPYSAIVFIHNTHHLSTNPQTKATAELCIIAWYYLLRVGEYTFTKIPEQRQTVQLRLQDVSLWHHHEKLNLTLPLHYLLAHCTSATLCINNQKNGKRNSIIHHHCITKFGAMRLQRT